MRKPMRAVLRAPVSDATLGTLFAEGPDDFPLPSETPVLVVPLTREAVTRLYDHLAMVFGGQTDRYQLAYQALATIGIEAVEPRPAREARACVVAEVAA